MGCIITFVLNRLKFYLISFQAFIGLSFSFGFITGPLIGAYFASKSRLPNVDSSNIFAFPAQIAVVIQLITMLIVVSLLDETSGLKEVT